jgi:hypothetical protein
MRPWLAIWIARLASGERFRKATSEDYRLQFGWFFFAGLLMVAVMTFGRRFFDHASSVSIWICATVVMCILVFGGIAWARRIPARVSFVLGIIAWGVFVWMALRGTL